MAHALQQLRLETPLGQIGTVSRLARTARSTNLCLTIQDSCLRSSIEATDIEVPPIPSSIAHMNGITSDYLEGGCTVKFATHVE